MTSAMAVTIAPMTTDVPRFRPAFSALPSWAMPFATPSEYCPTESSRAPLTKLASSPSQTSR